MAEKMKLKPCPFCGGERVHFDSSFVNSVVLIYCPDCTAVVSFGANKRDTQKFATEAYNRRAESGTGDALAMIEDAPTADVAPRAEVAAEIFAEIYSYLTPFPNRCALISLDALAELKKKYTEEQPCNQTIKQE